MFLINVKNTFVFGWNIYFYATFGFRSFFDKKIRV